jgi:hypothetical protein
VRVAVLRPAALAEEGEEHQPRHVEAGEAGGEHADHPGEQPDAAVVEGRAEDLVLGVEAGGEREADDRQPGGHGGQEGDRHHHAQAAELLDVGGVVVAVHHRAGPEEQLGLEEGVGDQVEDAGDVADRAEPHGDEHVAELADRRVRQDPFDVVLGGGDHRREQRGQRADHHHHGLGAAGGLEQRVGAGDQEHAGGDHGGGVDQGGHRRGADHGVRQPHVQWDLRALAGAGQEEQQGDGGGRPTRQPRGAAEDPVEVQAAERGEDQEHRQQEADVADAVGDEGLLGGRRYVRPGVPEADQQVRAEADALPAEEHHQEVLRQHQHQHGGGEQVQPGEVGAAPAVGGHVADRVEVDQRADPGDHQRERGRQLVPAQVHRHPQVAGEKPVPAAQDRCARAGVPAEQLGERRHGHAEGHEHQQRGKPAGGGPQAPAQQRVDGEAGQRQHWQQPDQADRAGSVQLLVTP